MKKKVAKTTGFTWLEHSINAFNGSGYADYDSPQAFIDSYIDYNKWKKRPEAVALVTQYYYPILGLARYLLENTAGPSHQPNPKLYDKFRLSRNLKLM